MENLFNFCFDDFSYPDSLPIQNIEPVAPTQPYEEVDKDGKKYIHCTFPNCGKTFRFKSEYQRHSVIHTVQRPFNCPYAGCFKTFKREDALKNHLRIHTGELPFKCEAEGCQESFPTKAGLRYHMLKHNGEKTFMCGYPGCNKSFLTQAQLRQHENSINFHKKIAWQVPEAQPVQQVQPVQVQPVQTPMTVTVNKVQKVKEPSIDNYFAPMTSCAGIEWGMQDQLENTDDVNQDLQEDFEKMVKVILKDNNAMKQRLGMCKTLMSLMHENNALKQKLDKVSGEVGESTNAASDLSDDQIYSFLNFSNQNVEF